MSEFYVYLHCRPDGEPFYVGKGKNGRSHDIVGKRAGRNMHHQNIVAKYGIENILIVVLPCESEGHAFRREIELIKAMRDADCKLVNQTDGGDGPSGCVRSEETRKKISEIQLGKILSNEHRAKISASLKGKPKSPGSGTTGMRLSLEWRRKIGDAQKGKPRQKHSEETKAKMSASRMGHAVSEETRRKLSAAHVGKGVKHKNKRAFRNLSPEHRARISASLRATFANKHTGAAKAAA